MSKFSLPLSIKLKAIKASSSIFSYLVLADPIDFFYNIQEHINIEYVSFIL